MSFVILLNLTQKNPEQSLKNDPFRIYFVSFLDEPKITRTSEKIAHPSIFCDWPIIHYSSLKIRIRKRSRTF